MPWPLPTFARAESGGLRHGADRCRPDEADQFAAHHVERGVHVAGGELAALVLLDAVTRLQPGVLNDAGSFQQDSFNPALDGLLASPPADPRPDAIARWGWRASIACLGQDIDAIRSGRRKEPS